MVVPDANPPPAVKVAIVVYEVSTTLNNAGSTLSTLPVAVSCINTFLPVVDDTVLIESTNKFPFGGRMLIESILTFILDEFPVMFFIAFISTMPASTITCPPSILDIEIVKGSCPSIVVCSVNVPPNLTTPPLSVRPFVKTYEPPTLSIYCVVQFPFFLICTANPVLRRLSA